MRILAKNKDENKKQHIFTIEIDTSEENKDLIDKVVYALLFAQESKLENFYWEYENRIDYALNKLTQLSKELSDVKIKRINFDEMVKLVDDYLINNYSIKLSQLSSSSNIDLFDMSKCYVIFATLINPSDFIFNNKYQKSFKEMRHNSESTFAMEQVLEYFKKYHPAIYSDIEKVL